VTTPQRTWDDLGGPMGSEEFAASARAIAGNIEQVIEGKAATVGLALAVLLAEGHLLIEDVPGDVFANLVVGDEINRASPKTQSAMLECMEERQVTIDGITYQLQVPFMVIATQNPIEMEGTYPLPEAQRDRFTARIAVGYPDTQAELAMLDVHGAHDPLDDLRPVADATTVRRMIMTVRQVHAADAVRQYAVNLVNATRESPDLRLGASPRATLHLLRTARAVAALEGRDYVLPDDLQTLAVSVLAHRIIPTAEAQLGRRTTDAIVADLVHRLPLPVDRQRSPYDRQYNSDRRR
jgi:MoxR-like ATPase